MTEIVIGALDPIAFKLGPLSVRWYGVIIGVAMFLAIWLSTKEAEKRGLNEEDIIDLSLWMIPIGFLGARLYYVLFEFGYYAQRPLQIFAIWEGGLAIYGGLIAGAFTIVWFSKKRAIPIWLLLDILAPAVLLAQSIGRWGNFMNQEAHGEAVSRAFLESLFLPEFIIKQMNIKGTFYHPTFLYESLWSLLGVVLLLAFRHRKELFRRGEVVLSYVIWYGVGRFFIEGMRTDSLYVPGTPLRISQALSLIFVLGALGLVWYRRRYIYPEVPYYMEGTDPEVRLEKRMKN